MGSTAQARDGLRGRALAAIRRPGAGYAVAGYAGGITPVKAITSDRITAL